MTKLLITLLALGFSLSSFAISKCPTLKGQYYCEGDFNRVLTVKEIDKEGIRLYKINNEILKADGIERKEDSMPQANKSSVRSCVVTCENKQLISVVTQTETGESSSYFRATLKYYIDDFGDFTRTELIDFGSSVVSSVSNCRKF